MGNYNNIKDAHAEIIKKVTEIRNKTLIAIFDSLVNDSPYGNPTLWKSKAPKGYHPGHFRANWQADIENIPGNEIDSTTLIPTALHLMDAKYGATIYMANNVAYAWPLEYGHSTQQPSGWIRTKVASGGGILQTIINQVGDK